MSSHPRRTVDTMEAIAVALAIYNQNGKRVIKYREDKPGSKELIYAHFAGTEIINNIDLKAADLIKQVITHQVTMSSIAGNTIPEFVMVVHEAIKSDKISSKEFGILAWAPKLADDMRTALEVKDQVYRLGSASRYIGAEHSKVELTFTLIGKRYLSHFNTSVYTGNDEHGNLVHFYSKKTIESGSKITAKIKRCATGRNAFAGARVTYLNYVKEVV